MPIIHQVVASLSIFQFASQSVTNLPDSNRRTTPRRFPFLTALALVAACLTANAQTRDWVWQGGKSTIFSVGVPWSAVYGTLGVPAATNIPGSPINAGTWTDQDGNFWLFGGEGSTGNGCFYNFSPSCFLDDLWKLNPSTKEWTWMGGNQAVNGNAPGIYGSLGAPAAGNVPGGRSSPSTWIDSSGNLWLFGGEGWDANGNPPSTAYASGTVCALNDLWQYTPSIGQWTWMGGSSTIASGDQPQPGVYGTLGVAAATNVPGGRNAAASWVDGKGDFWLFGGTNGISYTELFSDLWKFSPASGEWTWMGGSNSVSTSQSGLPGIYGTLGTPAPSNTPGGRFAASTWVDPSGNFWLFGGEGYDSAGNNGSLNDLWEFSPSSSEWAWMGGSNTITALKNGQYGVPGVYGVLGTAASTNMPGGRSQASVWIDAKGNVWLFGGYGDDVAGNLNPLNDLWEFNPSTGEWTWVDGSNMETIGSGDDLNGPSGVYGTLGVPAATNVPGGRQEASNWIDSNGNMWLFGGGGWDSVTDGQDGFLNDLWEYTLAPTVAATVSVTPASIGITTAQSLQVTVAVSGASGSPTPTGTVTLTSGSYTSTATALSAGSATITIAAGSLATGVDTLTASYSGDSNYPAATGTATVTVTTPVPPGFAVTGTTVSVAPGATTGNASTISVTPAGGFTGYVTLTAAISNGPANATDLPTLTFGSASPVGITGATAGTGTLTITTTAPTSAALTYPIRTGGRWYSTGGAVLTCILLFAIPARRRKCLTVLGMLILLLALTSGLLACGGGGSGGGGGTAKPGTTPGTYTITVTGTSGSTTAQGTVTLTVQ
jgi:hypothetical protein